MNDNRDRQVAAELLDTLAALPKTEQIDTVADLLHVMRWKEDQVITNYDGERVWLKPCFVKGRRMGITDCCPEEFPCERHAAMTHPAPARTQ